MMSMTRPEPDKVYLDLNNAHYGETYEIIFNEDSTIDTFERTGSWMS